MRFLINSRQEHSSFFLFWVCALLVLCFSGTGGSLRAAGWSTKTGWVVTSAFAQKQHNMVLPQGAESRYRVVKEQLVALQDSAEIVVQVFQEIMGEVPSLQIPVRAVVLDLDGHFADGSGRGTYDDGRFFAEGTFTVRVPAGRTHITLSSGPNHIPLAVEVDVEAGWRFSVHAYLFRWFEPELYGWYGGDNHVHAQHDQTATIKTDLAYAVLQARAGGLSFMTEQGSNVSYDKMETLSSDNFLLRFTPELRPGPFIGHLNTPGIAHPLSMLRYKQLVQQSLPAQALLDEVHRLGGAVIHTHPTTPPQQLHWMGAFELFSDAVLRKTADALDQDNALTQALWFAVLNLGNKMAASGYTDAALGRLRTLSPGDRRMYARAGELSYPSIIEAIRRGETFATNGGPLFPFFTLDNHPIGNTITIDTATELTVQIDIHTLMPITRMVLYRNGREEHVFDVAEQQGHISETIPIQVPGDTSSWYVLRVESEGDYWAMTSPIYVEPSMERPPSTASAMILQISNATRFIELRPYYFAHLIVTVGSGDPLCSVELLRDDEVVHQFLPEDGDVFFEDKIPVTEAWGEYGPGWVWHPDPIQPVHFQADWPVEEGGWYFVRATTVGGRLIQSDELFFDSENPNSQQIGLAQLDGRDTHLSLYGYGEEMPLAEIELPFEGDHWWYPQNTYYHMTAMFGDEILSLGDEPDHPSARLFSQE